MAICVFFLLLLCSPLVGHNLTYSTTKDGITLNAHIIQPQESEETFFHNLHAYSICPIQLTVTNNTEKTFLISGNSIAELSLLPPHTITKDIIFQYNTLATITAYGCALTGWLSTMAGARFIRTYIPKFSTGIKYFTTSIALLSFFYKAHMFAIRLSESYCQTNARIIDCGLSATNTIIDPETTITKVMFLNQKSYPKPPVYEQTFYYLFSIKFYNLYDSNDRVTLNVAVPKIYTTSELDKV